MEQVLGAVLAVIVALAAAVAYFWGSNWLLDKFLVGDASAEGSVRQDRLRTSIRPWLFLAPALLFLSLYLVYPVFETIRLSLFNANGSRFVGFSNYIWAINDANFRQSLLNNFLWLLIVPALSTAFGLVIAVLADRVWWGNIAKSLIFMPMAISFVGASVIWRFVYAYRGPDQPQIGVLNAIATGLGNPPQNWLTIIPWNSFLLMVILIWIQTGFAMVILSAALRGIPEETIEAARIDGANDIQIFFTIMIPQITGTLIVVWTTITITVLKVFDIVFAMTGGQFQTEVLANLMYSWMFRSGDFGRGSTIAVVILIAVLPIMIWNIRNANREQGTR
ncbi:sugar ABC transporter permease [Pelagibacterium sp. 26DY04]|uniref:carbohydrate ABC transporter permease n=1 Tax=unclassified Pelagibacterium TaxID=2623280 RepID=UPI002814E1FA|nr:MULTISPECIES: sugar ABC transporter permease [unclassified Pelagibacterium]WMT88825.1 sugar ABC transporter permease [Pelagibacterium sp. 26DY04]WMT92388.1 sugar ABC transporter permease [Pelagibacterium sp. H642]